MLYGLQDIKGIQVPVFCKFRKGSLLSFHPMFDDVQNVYFVVHWGEKVIRVTARHGVYMTEAEFKGEEWSINITGAVVYYPENGEVPSLKEQQEIALEVAREAQSYLRSVADVTEEVKDTIGRLLNPGGFVKYRDVSADEFFRMELAIQKEARKKIAQN